MRAISELGIMALGSRLKRLSDYLIYECAKIYKSHDVGFEPRWFPLFQLLLRNERIAISDAAAEMGQSIASASQIAQTMKDAGVVTITPDPKDERRKVLEFTAKGKKLEQEVRPVWNDIRTALENLMRISGADLIPQLSLIENAIQKRSLQDFILNASSEFQVVPFRRKYRREFSAINKEWLEEYGFPLEKSDREYLSDPEENVLGPGGKIFFLKQGARIVGTCALIRGDNGQYEIAKMGIRKEARGKGAGKYLLSEVLKHARNAGCRKIVIFTSSRLVSAIRLYGSFGFEDRSSKNPGKYQRADVYLEKIL